MAMESGQAEIVTWSKDSISIRWRFEGSSKPTPASAVQPRDTDRSMGYVIYYTPIGSFRTQKSDLLAPSTTSFEITQLHENTNYKICVMRMRRATTLATVPPQSSSNAGRNLNPVSQILLGPATATGALFMAPEAEACVHGTTSTDSLSVALGSTFGAFLALGLIVGLVFAAKWQHVKKTQKRLEAAMQEDCDGFDDVTGGAGDVLELQNVECLSTTGISSVGKVLTPPGDGIYIPDPAQLDEYRVVGETADQLTYPFDETQQLEFDDTDHIGSNNHLPPFPVDQLDNGCPFPAEEKSIDRPISVENSASLPNSTPYCSKLMPNYDSCVEIDSSSLPHEQEPSSTDGLSNGLEDRADDR